MRYFRTHVISYGQLVPQEGSYFYKTDCLIVVQLNPGGTDVRYLYADRNGRVGSDNHIIDTIASQVGQNSQKINNKLDTNFSNVNSSQLNNIRGILDIHNRATRNASNVATYRSQWREELKFLDTYSNQTITGGKTFNQSMRIAAFDLALGFGDQVTRGNSGSSRALVKDNGGSEGSRLTINYGTDFPAGVLVQSKLYTSDNLVVNGTTTSTGNITAPAFYESSLREYKENIRTYTSSGLDLINSLDIVTYDRKDGIKDKIGVIADDTDEQFLSENKDSVDLYKTIFILSKAVQELSEEVEFLKARIDGY